MKILGFILAIIAGMMAADAGGNNALIAVVIGGIGMALVIISIRE